MRRFTCLRSKRSIEKKVGLCWILIYHPLFITFDVPISSVGSICSTVVCCSKAQWVERGIESDRINDVRNTNMHVHHTYINHHQSAWEGEYFTFDRGWICMNCISWRGSRSALGIEEDCDQASKHKDFLRMLHACHILPWRTCRSRAWSSFEFQTSSRWQICELHLHALIHCPFVDWGINGWQRLRKSPLWRRPWHHVVVLMGEKCGPINGNLPIEYPQMSIMEIYRL